MTLPRIVSVAVAVLAVTPAHAERPPQVEALLQNAGAAQARGDMAAAVSALEAAAGSAPGDADVLRRLGTAQGQIGRTEAALATLTRAQRVAPDDADIRLAIGQVHYYRGEHRAALGIAEEIIARQPDNHDAKDLAERTRRALAESADARWRLDWSASYSHFEDDARERWLESSAALGYRINDQTSITGRLDVADRFGSTDVYGEARVDHRFAPGRSAYLALGAAPGANFLPEWALQGGLGLRAWRGGLGDGVITVDVRHARYSTGSVETLSPGIEQYVLGGRAWLTGRLILTWDEDDDQQTGYLLRGDAMATERVRLFAGYADAPETVQNVTLTTRSIFAGGVIELSERLSLRLDYVRDDRERSYVRHAATAGVGVRF